MTKKTFTNASKVVDKSLNVKIHIRLCTIVKSFPSCGICIPRYICTGFKCMCVHLCIIINFVSLAHTNPHAGNSFWFTRLPNTVG